ncbi:uncharacterized protein LOC135500024 isoform X2 [Lineus longissimus]|uniref:uncharacterized protein LOC135500024 isoform X2 n=1 Tax=Lineus longissimus TaxID=88925 RepID=UPI00315D69F9
MDKFYERVFTLNEFLDVHDAGERCRSPPIQPDDTEGYKEFLQTTVIGIAVGDVEYNWDLHNEEQTDLVAYMSRLFMAVEDVFRQEGKENMLTRGVRHVSMGNVMNKKPSILTPKDPRHADAPSLEFDAVNSGIEELKGKYWRILYERIGSLLIHAIKHTSIFVSVEEENLIQITGKPLDILTIEKKRHLKELRSGYRYQLVVKPTHIYGTDLREAFPNAFIRKAPDPETVHKMLMRVLMMRVQDHKPFNEAKLEVSGHDQLVACLILLLKKHRKMEKKFKFLVRSRFPMPDLAKAGPEALVQSFHREDKIHSFVTRCLHGVLPTELLGSSQNLSSFLRNLKKMLNRKKYEQFTLGELLKDIKVSKMYWMRQYESEVEKTAMVAKVLRWLLAYCMALIEGYFYVTDTSVRSIPGVYVYYRKPVWAILIKMGVKDCIERGLIAPVSKDSTQRQLLRTSCVRFVPKQNTVRPIQMMGQKINKVSVNMQLIPVKDAIGWVLSKEAATIPHQTFATYADKIASMEQRPRLYYINLDIKNCFDNLNAGELYRTVINKLKDVPSETLYTRKVVITRPHRGTSNILRKMSAEGEFHGIKGYVASLAKHHQFRKVVFVDKMLNQPRKTKDICRLLDSHLNSNQIKFHPNGQVYMQTQGVSQGSVAAGNLCELAFRKLEEEFQFNESEFYQRHVDDVLFISPERRRIRRLFRLFHCRTTGQGPCNVSVNLGKSLTNCPGIPVRYIDNDTVTSVGIVFDLETLTVQPQDICGGVSVDRYTICSRQRPGQVIRSKLIKLVFDGIMSNKVKAVFYQLPFNTEAMIIRKAHATFTCLVILWKGFSRKLGFNFDQNIKQSVGLFRSLYRIFFTYATLRLRKLSKGDFPLTKDQVGWLWADVVRESLKTSWKTCPKFYGLVRSESRSIGKRVGIVDVRKFQDILDKRS